MTSFQSFLPICSTNTSTSLFECEGLRPLFLVGYMPAIPAPRFRTSIIQFYRKHSAPEFRQQKATFRAFPASHQISNTPKVAKKNTHPLSSHTPHLNFQKEISLSGTVKGVKPLSSLPFSFLLSPVSLLIALIRNSSMSGSPKI